MNKTWTNHTVANSKNKNTKSQIDGEGKGGRVLCGRARTRPQKRRPSKFRLLSQDGNLAEERDAPGELEVFREVAPLVHLELVVVKLEVHVSLKRKKRKSTPGHSNQPARRQHERGREKRQDQRRDARGSKVEPGAGCR